MGYWNERTAEIPWLKENLSKGNCLDIGSCESAYIDILLEAGPTTRIDLPSRPFSDIKCKVILEDIRNLSPQKIGLFDNVLLIGSLEHMGPSGYFIKKFEDKTPFVEQKRIFFHSFGFVKEKGFLYLTVPVGKYEDLGWILNWTLEFIEEIKSHYQVEKEDYFSLNKNHSAYERVNGEEIPLVELEKKDFNGAVRAYSVACLKLKK